MQQATTIGSAASESTPDARWTPDAAREGEDDRGSGPLHAVGRDAAAIRAAFGRFPSGLAAICAEVEGEPRGIVASSFSVGVSYDPPIVMFSVQQSSTTWPVLRTATRLGISVLGAGHSAAARQLASRRGDRFRGLRTHSAASGALFIDDTTLWLECAVLSETPAGDHRVVLLEVESLRVDARVEPLVYHSAAFRSLAAAS